MGAIVLNGAKIGQHSLVGAGALVTEGKEFPDNSLIVGAPARGAHARREGREVGLVRGRMVREALESVCEGVEEDRLRYCAGPKMGAAGRGGRPAAREPGLGTGRGGDVTGREPIPLQREVLCSARGDDAVAMVGRGSPSATQRLGSVCDCRFT